MNGRWVALVLWALTAAWKRGGGCSGGLASYAIDEAQLRLPDGTLEKIYLARDGFGAAITSTDNGHTWSEPEKPVQRWANKVFLDRDGQMHGFLILLREGASGRKIAIDRFLDVWHFKTSGPEKMGERSHDSGGAGMARLLITPCRWPTAASCNLRRIGCLAPGRDRPRGMATRRCCIPDDGGETWKRSNKITSPVFSGIQRSQLRRL